MSGHRSYSPVRTAAGLGFTAGILGRGTDGALVAGGTVPELQQALEVLDGLLAGHGAGRVDVVRLVVYLASIDDLVAMDGVFRDWFAEPRPARSTVQVAALPGGASIEIEATFALPDPA